MYNGIEHPWVWGSVGGPGANPPWTPAGMSTLLGPHGENWNERRALSSLLAALHRPAAGEQSRGHPVVITGHWKHGGFPHPFQLLTQVPERCTCTSMPTPPFPSLCSKRKLLSPRAEWVSTESRGSPTTASVPAQVSPLPIRQK